MQNFLFNPISKRAHKYLYRDLAQYALEIDCLKFFCIFFFFADQHATILASPTTTATTKTTNPPTKSQYFSQAHKILSL